MKPSQFFKFLAAGGTAAAANFFSRMLFSVWLPYTVAIIAAYIVGMITAFFLNRMFVFRGATNSMRHQAVWFIAVNLAAVTQTVVISLGLARYVFPALGMHQHVETIAHAFGVAVPVITSYVGHSRLSFRTN